MEKIGTHRVFRLDTPEGIKAFDEYRHEWFREYRLSISNHTGIIPDDNAYKYFSSDKALGDSLERWQIGASTPTRPDNDNVISLNEPVYAEMFSSPEMDCAG